MQTDQTSGLVPVDAEDPLFSMLNAIRAMIAESQKHHIKDARA
jgi:hypothetical protein